MTTASPPRTMFEKIWDAHVVHSEEGKQTILYIDLQLVHEVTSPQAFEGLRLAGRKVRRPERTVAPLWITTFRPRTGACRSSTRSPSSDRHPAAQPEFGVRLFVHDPQQGWST